MNRHTIIDIGRWIGVVLMAIVLLFMVGCSSLGNNAQLPIQFATLKYIEQTGTEAQTVIDHVERIRALVDRDSTVTPDQIAAQILDAVDTRQLTPSETLLLTALITSAQDAIQEVNLIEPDTRLSILQVLGWVEAAARMAL